MDKKMPLDKGDKPRAKSLNVVKTPAQGVNSGLWGKPHITQMTL
jgi:hypothetical protein